MQGPCQFPKRKDFDRLLTLPDLYRPIIGRLSRNNCSISGLNVCREGMPVNALQPVRRTGHGAANWGCDSRDWRLIAGSQTDPDPADLTRADRASKSAPKKFPIASYEKCDMLIRRRVRLRLPVCRCLIARFGEPRTGCEYGIYPLDNIA